MNKKSLRVGNLLKFEGEVVEIDGVQEGLLSIKGNGYWSLAKDFEPVTLTEDWLKDFGFETSPKSDRWTLYLSDKDKDEFARQRIDVCFMESRTVAELCRAGVCFKMVTCNYVHDIQNLYFELKITHIVLESKINNNKKQ